MVLVTRHEFKSTIWLLLLDDLIIFTSYSFIKVRHDEKYKLISTCLSASLLLCPLLHHLPIREILGTLTSKKQSQVDLGTVGSGSRKLSALNLALTDGALDDAVVQRLSLAAIEPLSYQRRFIKDFCPPFVDAIRGIRPWIKRMPSDYRDAFHKDNAGIVFSSVLFLYFVNLAPCITFAALLSKSLLG